MLGYQVTKPVLDMKAADAVLALRSAFDKVETVAKFLADHPSDGTTDPLITDFEYTADEAYVLRVVFENFETVRLNNASFFGTARKITGLE